MKSNPDRLLKNDVFHNAFNIIERSLYFKCISTLNYSYMARTFNVIPQLNTNILLTNDNILPFQTSQDPAEKKQGS